MRAVLDACVLYPTVLREILLATARQGLIQPLWSERILEEWRRVGARGGAAEDALTEGEIARVCAAFPDALVTWDPALEARLWLPDRHDIHVLAAAIAGRAQTIITLNLPDFPRRELDEYGISALHPDACLRAFWETAPDRIEAAVGGVLDEADRLSGQVLDRRKLLKRARLPRLAKALFAGA